MIRQLFCAHKWKTHFKEIKNVTTFRVNEKMQDQLQQVGGVGNKIVEILICEKCGKIKKLAY